MEEYRQYLVRLEKLPPEFEQALQKWKVSQPRALAGIDGAGYSGEADTAKSRLDQIGSDVKALGRDITKSLVEYTNRLGADGSTVSVLKAQETKLDKGKGEAEVGLDTAKGLYENVREVYNIETIRFIVLVVTLAIAATTIYNPTMTTIFAIIYSLIAPSIRFLENAANIGIAAFKRYFETKYIF